MIINLMRLSILIIAGFSAISAVAGLGAVFKGAYWPMVCAGVGIELGKYSLVAYSMQQWGSLNNRFKWSVVVVAVYVSLLTSAGVYGYLASAFQQTHKTAQKSELDIGSLKADKVRMESRLSAIDIQISQLPPEFVSGRLRLTQAFDDERRELTKSLKSVNEKLSVSQISSVDTLGELGPIVSIAEVVNASIETAVGWMILAVALALDPFALYMTLLINRQTIEVAEKKVEEVVVSEPVTEVKKDVVEEETLGWNFK